MQNVELPLHAINCTSRKAIGTRAGKPLLATIVWSGIMKFGTPRWWVQPVVEDYLSIECLSRCQPISSNPILSNLISSKKWTRAPFRL